MPKSVRTFVVGDPHFKAKFIQQGREFIEKCVEAAVKAKPSFIVLLGDILDTHEIVRVAPHKLACLFIEKMSEVAPTYVLMGNHDLINQMQFQTDEHIFNPLKKWSNVFIVDEAMELSIRSHRFIFCPYVPPGRFVEALNTLPQSFEDATCIFAHQEIRGCKLNDEKDSVVGDKWKDKWPRVISGHIHTAQDVGTNVFFPGCAMQHDYKDEQKKCVWVVDFTGKEMKIDKIQLPIRGKKFVRMNIDEVPNFDFAQLDVDDVKLEVSGTSEAVKMFRKSQIYLKLQRKGVKMAYDTISLKGSKPVVRTKAVTFESVLKDVVSKKDEAVQEAYREVTEACYTSRGKQPSEARLATEGSETGDSAHGD